MEWFKEPVTLTGEKVILSPLHESHFDGLIAAADNADIWTFFTINGRDREPLLDFLNTGIRNRDLGTHYPFTVFDKQQNKIIGTTRFGNISQLSRSVEIGWTWYNPEYWSKGYNEECKLLLLTYAFEQLDTLRVELKTWEKNMRSRKAILRIGAQFEGILRNNFVPPATIRNSAYYSIIPEEWAQVKQSLHKMMTDKYQKLDAAG